MFNKVLVANRGEIARRVFTACRELEIRSVAIYSEADKLAPWTRLADESYPLTGVAAGETYLNQEIILEIAKLSAADAVHPGYGFLSENPAFAEACTQHGLTFIGPGAAAMRIMGSKTAARLMARRAGVPVVPGTDGAGKNETELLAAASAIGYPVLIKASAGGGGKGMRVVASEAEFVGALQAARKEALAAFDDDHILVEKFFTEVHHVEIQVLADTHGNMIHLFERECSVQRRHQKIIEESPAPILPFLDEPETVRQKMAEAALALAGAVDYVNAGTIEFVVDASPGSQDSFFFLEMNTRLQVEHPVTELVTGLDLVAWQIRVAAGEPLPFDQAAFGQRGHAIECRIYAEDPANQFLPSTGEIGYYRPPQGPGVRVDDGIGTGTIVSPYYDPMLAKVIAWGQNRSEAIGKMERALRDTVILGLTTNIPYLLDILRQPSFIEGRTSTSFIQDHMAGWRPKREPSESDLLALAALELLQGWGAPHDAGGHGAPLIQPDPWHGPSSWRNVR